MEKPKPNKNISVLHDIKVNQPVATINRAFTLIRSIPILALLYYRASSLYFLYFFKNPNNSIFFPWLIISISELILSLTWLIHQPFMWRPVTRTAFPERLNCKDDDLPAVDVFICTADPEKEPVIEVMNTVLSTLALDYPTEKLFVYLSDDAGSSITLSSIRDTWVFAKSWVPFCRKFGIKTRCPEAYFSRSDEENDDIHQRGDEFIEEEEKIKSLYELLKEQIRKAGESVTPPNQDRACLIQVINDNGDENINLQMKLPLLTYVAREKRPSHPHHFKAGALNVLLRVSGITSNSPYILVLDCDMYCNDPSSARQAMCFHLDSQINRSLAFVQFPQIFYSLSKNDIYDGQMRSAYKTKWQGMDGIKGPVLSGTGFYLKRQALYGSPDQKEMELHQLKEFFGTSNEFVSSLRRNYRSNIMENVAQSSNTPVQNLQILASSDFENDTKWGEQVGFLYQCMLESTFTGYYLHCQGWNSVYLYPSRPAFLGCPATNMNDALVQGMKWSSELFRVGLSKLSPVTYALSRMSILQTMCYMYFIFSPLSGLVISIYAIVTQLCLFNGIPLYPKVSEPWFGVFAAAYISCIGQHLFEVLSSDGSIKMWWNELRIWMIKSVTASLIGVFDAILKQTGLIKTRLKLTNKAVDNEQLEKYKKGKFELKGSTIFLIPLIILVIFNIISLIRGLVRIISEKTYDEMFGQVFLSLFVLILSYPIIEGTINRKNKSRG